MKISLFQNFLHIYINKLIVFQLEIGRDVTEGTSTNVLKNFDFPTEYKSENGIITERDIKFYFKLHKNSDALTKYSNLDFLIYLSKKIDVEVKIIYLIKFQTAEHYARQISIGYIDQEILEEILKSLGTIE